MALPDELETLAEVLQRNGYYTMGAVSVAHLNRRYGFGQGFDVFSDSWDATKPSNDAHQRNADDTNVSTFGLIDGFAARDSVEPFFLFVHYFDVHFPYVIHEPSMSDSISARYSGEVHFVDQKLSELVGHLEGAGLTDNLVVVVTADHGEQLGEHGYEGGHADIYRETIRVPLIVSGPGIPRGRYAKLVTTMDIAPTILDLAGAEFSHPVSGSKLFDIRSEPTQFLVLGYPAYTRSLGLLTEENYFIRNLDPYYMHMVQEEIGEKAELDKSVPAEPLGDGRYGLPLLSKLDRMEPVYIALEVHLQKPTCRAELSVHAAPRLDYLDKPLAFVDAVRIYVPAITLRDVVTVSIEPSDCIRSVRYLPSRQIDIDAFRASLAGNFDTKGTKIWKDLLTLRKRTDGDELYRWSSDPGMRINVLSGEAREKRRALVKRWRALASRERVSDADAYTQEEIRLLRSLGYLQ